MFAGSKDSINVAQTTKLEQVSNVLGQTTGDTFDQLVQDEVKTDVNLLVGLIIALIVCIIIVLIGVKINSVNNFNENGMPLIVIGSLIGAGIFIALMATLPDIIYSMNHPEVEIIRRMILGR